MCVCVCVCVGDGSGIEPSALPNSTNSFFYAVMLLRGRQEAFGLSLSLWAILRFVLFVCAVFFLIITVSHLFGFTKSSCGKMNEPSLPLGFGVEELLEHLRVQGAGTQCVHSNVFSFFLVQIGDAMVYFLGGNFPPTHTQI